MYILFCPLIYFYISLFPSFFLNIYRWGGLTDWTTCMGHS